MDHLFVGVDAQSVRMEPYIPSFSSRDGLLPGNVKLPLIHIPEPTRQEEIPYAVFCWKKKK